MILNNTVLNDNQIKAVEDIVGPVMVFAGAGSGKTRTLTYRIAHMIANHGIAPHKILAITFTNKATKEMIDRLNTLIGPVSKSVNISTFHSLCARILRSEIGVLGYSRRFDIIDEEDQLKALKEALKEANTDIRQFSAKGILSKIGRYKNGMEELVDFFKKPYQAYQDYLKRNNLVDFDDLLVLAHEIFENHPTILEKYQTYFQYVLVDEFQDTNDIQYEIAKMIAKKHKNLFVVGDDDQSIYGFRGANIANIDHFRKDFPEARVYVLDQNYRSSQVILDGCNRLIGNNKNREPKNLWSKTQGSQSDITFFQGYDHYEEANFVASKIRDYFRNGFQYDEIAVLYRSNVISRNFELALIQAGIPYKIYGGYSYLKRKEVKDALAYLKFILDPNNLIHFQRIINAPSRGIGEKTVSRIVEIVNMNDCSLFEAINRIQGEVSKSKQIALTNFCQLIESLKSQIDRMTLEDFFDEMIEKSDYLSALDQEENKDDRIQNLAELKSVLVEIDALPMNDGLLNSEKLQKAFDEIILSESVQDEKQREGGKSVTLSTIHSAKGLEFHIVFVVALEDEIFPNRFRINEGDADIEEERRIAYVATTRAKEKLILTNAKSRLIYGKTMRHRQSQFLVEFVTDAFKKAHIVQENLVKPSEESSNAIPIKTGDRVIHKDFGEGIVIASDKFIVQILFNRDSSLRKFLANHSSIRKM